MADVGDAVHYEYASHGIGETQGTKVTPLHGSEGTIHVIEVPYYYISTIATTTTLLYCTIVLS